MKAVAYQKASPITSKNALIDIEIDAPTAQGHDLLIRVQAVSVNPVDTNIIISSPNLWSTWIGRILYINIISH